jgi:hypothetical protein
MVAAVSGRKALEERHTEKNTFVRFIRSMPAWVGIKI